MAYHSQRRTPIIRIRKYHLSLTVVKTPVVVFVLTAAGITERTNMDKLTYLAESKVRVTDPARESGAVLSMSKIVLRTLGVVAGEDTIIWYLDRDTNQIIPKKKVKP